MDRTVGQIPDSMFGGLISSTPSCVAVGTLSEHDGEIRITLGDTPDHDRAQGPVFDGVIETPNRRVAVCSVLDDVILEIAVEGTRARVQVWASDELEPDEIDITVSTPGA